MLVGVRIGGSPIFSAPFRWGHGWAYPRWYGDLTEQEQWQVEKKSAEIPAPLSNTVYPRNVQDENENSHDKDAHSREAVQVQPVQLCFYWFWHLAESYEDAHLGKTIQVQPM